MQNMTGPLLLITCGVYLFLWIDGSRGSATSRMAVNQLDDMLVVSTGIAEFPVQSAKFRFDGRLFAGFLAVSVLQQLLNQIVKPLLFRIIRFEAVADEVFTIAAKVQCAPSGVLGGALLLLLLMDQDSQDLARINFHPLFQYTMMNYALGFVFIWVFGWFGVGF